MKSPKFNKGDKVRIINAHSLTDLDLFPYLKHVGEIHEIAGVLGDGKRNYYHLIGTRWTWDEDYLESTLPTKIKFNKEDNGK